MLFCLGTEISADEELKEQKEITSIHDERCRVIFALNHARVVRQIIVESHQRYSNANNHLRNLKRSDNDWVEPFWAKTHCHEEIVEIHAGVNRVVHNNKENTRRRLRDIGMPAIQ